MTKEVLQKNLEKKYIFFEFYHTQMKQINKIC